MSSDQKEIGGYFEFNLPDLGQFPYPLSKKYISARSAFFDLLAQNDIKKIWMPKFICDSMIEPLLILNITIKFYELDERFYPKFLDLEDDEYILYVNYFGICTTVQKKLMDKYPRNQLIFDHSQAFFVEPFECFATIYSLRKFLPVAEGGLLVSQYIVSPSYAIRDVKTDIQQYAHSFIRRLSTASNAYEIFRDNELVFNECIPRNISGITDEIISCLNYIDIQSQRLDNFKFLHAKLGSINQLHIDIDNLESPLTYPLLLDKNISKQLIDNNIFTPTYWLDSLDRVIVGSFEYNLILNTTHLVCDQRYSQKEMQFQIDLIQDYIQ